MCERVNGKRMIPLVVGGDSAIGRALAASYRRSGHDPYTTTRRPAAVGERNLFLDLSEDVAAWEPPAGVSVAFLLGAATKIDTCREMPQETRRVNVEGICSVARKLAARGIFPIFLSTNLVFDGTAPFCRPDDPVAPRTAYGRQKAEAERSILDTVDPAAVIRVTKVLGPPVPLFAAWLEALRQGREIHPFADSAIAPVPLSCVVALLRLVADVRLRGMLQLSASEDVTYAEIARFGARLVGADPALVAPAVARDGEAVKEPSPRYGSLDTERLRVDLGVLPPPVWWTIEKAFLDPAALAGGLADEQRGTP